MDDEVADDLVDEHGWTWFEKVYGEPDMSP